MAPAALASPPGAQPLSPATVIGQDASAVTLLLGANPSFGTGSGSSGTKEHSWWQSRSKAVQCQHQREAGTCPVNIRYKSCFGLPQTTQVLEAHLAAHWWWRTTSARGLWQARMRRCHLGAVFVYFMVSSFRPPSWSCYNTHTVLECHPLRAMIGKRSWRILGIPVVEATGAAAAAGDRPVRTLSCHPHTRTIHYFFVSAKFRSIVVSPEVLVSVPCPPHLPVRLQTMARPREWCVQVVRRLPAVPIFRRRGCGHTSSATHHQRKWRRGPRTRPDRGECGLWLGVSPDGLAPRANRDSSMGWCSRDETLAWHCGVLPLRLVSCRCPPDTMQHLETKRTVLSAGCPRSEHLHSQ